ncbi:MAG: flagellar hook-basal body complex protein [Tissierellaceae bacterium]|nr:flagellar hook-basal body complex protein [Tissierellaceae bacterium]
MLRSLYSGVSGMRSFQTKMDVISNNIANVNTTGFKSGRAKFQDMLSQTISNAQGASANGLGGVNSQQIGLGVRVGSIDTIMTGGAMQPTNRDLDFAIEGEGFFTVSPNGSTNNVNYTRDGAFYKDNVGNLVNASGDTLMGYMPDTFGGALNTGSLKALEIPNNHPSYSNPDRELESYYIDSSGTITAKYENIATPVTIGQIVLTRFSNPEGLEKTGGNNYRQTNNSGTPVSGTSGNNGFGIIRQGYLEMSNVDLANEFTEMIVTSRAYQANSRSITTSDEMLQELINLKR